MKFKIPRKYGKLKPGSYTAVIDSVTLHRNGNVTVRLDNVEEVPLPPPDVTALQSSPLKRLVGKRVVVQINRKEASDESSRT